MAKKRGCHVCHGIGGYWMNIDDPISGIHIHAWQPCYKCGGR